MGVPQWWLISWEIPTKNGWEVGYPHDLGNLHVGKCMKMLRIWRKWMTMASKSSWCRLVPGRASKGRCAQTARVRGSVLIKHNRLTTQKLKYGEIVGYQYQIKIHILGININPYLFGLLLIRYKSIIPLYSLKDKTTPILNNYRDYITMGDIEVNRCE